MTEPAPTPRLSFAGPLFLWLVVQLIALAIPVARLPITAGLGSAPERLALSEMLAIQIIAAGMLFPILLQSWATTLVILASTPPYVLLATSLSSQSWRAAIFACLYTALWILALKLWQLAIPARLHGILIACVNLITVGLPLIQYLHAEFSPNTGWPPHFSPISAGIAQLQQPQIVATLWLFPLITFALGALLLGVRKWLFRSERGAISHF